MFEVPQRQQLASVRAPLSLFAPAPSTISFVPLTRNLSLADPSPTRGWTGLSEATATRFSVLRTTKCDAFSEARRTKNRLLRYGRDIRCQKRLPVVRDVFSEAFGVKNRRFWYGRDIQCAKQASVVRDAFSGALGAQKRPHVWYATHSATKKGSWGTRCIFKGPQNSRLHRLWTASCHSGSRFSARNAHRSEVSKYKKRMTSKSIKTF